MVPPPAAYADPLAAAWLMLRSGEIRRANLELTQLGRTDADRTPHEHVLLTALSIEARLAVGDLGAATALADALAPACREEDGLVRANAHLALGEVAAAIGDHANALMHHTTAGTAHDGAETIRPWRVGAALALVRLGRRTEGAALAREQVAAATDPHDLATSLRTLAIADTGNGPVGVLRRALTAAELTPDRRLVAQIGADMAGLMLLAPSLHDTAEAVRLLRDAEAYAAAEGLWPLHTRVVRQLAHAGERGRPLEGQALDLLTAAERRVSRLAVAGMSNREIAETLHVTVKGVEWHLSRVYRKLGIGSREALAQLLGAEALAS